MGSGEIRVRIRFRVSVRFHVPALRGSLRAVCIERLFYILSVGVRVRGRVCCVGIEC